MVGITLISAALLAAAQVAVAKPVARSSYALKDRHHVPRGWAKRGRAPADQLINLQIGLKQNNFKELERHLYEVSDPAHSRYGQHLTGDQVNDFVRPSEETSSLVHEWLGDNGIKPASYSAANDWITISIPVSAVEQLLDTEYHTYEHVDGSVVARAPAWSLPRHLHAHIDTIQPTNSFFRARKAATTSFASELVDDPSLAGIPTAFDGACNVSSVTPECFKDLYGLDGYKTQSTCKNKVAFTNYLGEHPIRSDAVTFAEKYVPSEVDIAKNFPQYTIAGGPGDYPLTPEELESSTSIEANLDIQALLGVSAGTPIFSYSTGGEPPFDPSVSTPDNTNEPYLVWVNWLLAKKSFPQIISTSYADDEQTVPLSYAKRVCEQFAQVGARGTSLLFASGDDGVGTEGTCVSNDGKNTTMFTPLFPPSCPFITSVGATRNFEPEVVADRPAYTGADGVSHGDYVSGGGFGNYFSAPAYQKKVVDAYVEGLDGLYDGLYNKEGRAYPDISAQGLYFAYFWNGTEGVVSGTSASTPLLSGILSLVNDARLAQGKKALGFLNPWLYSVGYKGLNDITEGSARGCGTDGFPAVEGWDPVTGFGTPNFPKLIEL